MRTATRRSSLSGTPRKRPLILQRLANLVLQELADRAAIDTAQDLAVDVAVVQRMVGGALADREHRCQVGDAAAHLVPVGQPVWRVTDWRLRDTGLVAKRVTQGRGLSLP